MRKYQHTPGPRMGCRNPQQEMLCCLAREPMNRSKERAQTFVVALNEYVTWDMMISLQHAEPIFLKKLFIYLASLSQLTFIIINLS